MLRKVIIYGLMGLSFAGAATFALLDSVLLAAMCAMFGMLVASVNDFLARQQLLQQIDESEFYIKTLSDSQKIWKEYMRVALPALSDRLGNVEAKVKDWSLVVENLDQKVSSHKHPAPRKRSK